MSITTSTNINTKQSLWYEETKQFMCDNG